MLGMAAAVLLAVLTVGLPLVELNRAQHTTLEVAGDSQETTYYLGVVGEQLARLRFHVLLSGSTEYVSHIKRLLQTALDALPGALDLALWPRWIPLEREVARLRRVYEDAAALTHARDPARVIGMLASETVAMAHVHDSLSDLVQVHRGAVLARLRAAHRAASWLGTLEIVFAGVFLIGLIAIWSIMLRALRRQRRQLAEYTARLESANEDLDAFAGRVAHDLRNALGPIVLTPAMLRQSPAETTAILDLADRIERFSRRAVAMMDGLLAFSRAGHSADADEAGALRSAVTNVVEEVTPSAAQLDVSLEVGELPDVQVRCSPSLLHIVLANLCGNAVKYLAGRAERRVHISAEIESSRCRIQVEDTGPGIPAEAQAKIFEPFYRVPGTRAPGTGIGLTTVRRIVDARGGRVDVQSEVGRGTCFRVWLPLAPPAKPSA